MRYDRRLGVLDTLDEIELYVFSSGVLLSSYNGNVGDYDSVRFRSFCQSHQCLLNCVVQIDGDTWLQGGLVHAPLAGGASGVCCRFSS